MTRIYTCNVPIEADLVDAFCWLQKGFTDQFVYYDKQRACRYMGLGRCIALPSLRDVEYEYGEGSSLREVATGAAASEVAGGAGAGQPPVFFSFNRFDATNPAPADELMASFPRLRFMLPEIVLIENERGRFLQVNSLGPVYPGRVARFTRMVASAPTRQRTSIPFALEPDSREAWGEAMDAALAAIGEGRVSKVVLSRRLRLAAEHPFSSKDLLVNLIDGDARGTVHVNFPFDAPLKPDFAGADLQAMQRAAHDCFALGARNASIAAKDGARLDLGPLVGPAGTLPPSSIEAIERLLWKRPSLVLAGEGSCETVAEAEEILAWARKLSLPVLADPLSGLRPIDDPLIIDNYDNLCARADCPAPEVVIRFGRYPISKSATALLERTRPVSLAVDVAETRDFNAATDVFVGTTPLGFVRSGWRAEGRKAQRRFADAWVALNDEARLRILAVEWDGVATHDSEATEGAYVRSLLELAPEGSCLFSANSMSIRAVDTFYVKDGKPLAVMANRGQNGIDGVVSTAVGAAQHFAQTTFLTGDFTLLHDLSGLALQREMLLQRRGPEGTPSLVIVLLNNNGGGIFDMLPQASADPYFERLFLAPQDVRFTEAAAAFGIPSASVHTVGAFRSAYEQFLGTPGISLIEVALPLRGVRDRYAPYQR